MRLVTSAVLVAAALVAGCQAGWNRNQKDYRSMHFGPGVPKPTPAEIAAADIGPEPDLEAGRRLVEAAIKEELIDPESAQFTWDQGGFVRGAYWPDADPYQFGWRTVVRVNAKNKYGGYTGRKYYNAHIRHGVVVRVGGGTVYLEPPAE